MILLGILLWVLGLILGIGLLQTVGGVLFVIGLVLWLLGQTGRPIGGRRFWW